MNFVDAAIALLEEQKAPLPVEVLCQLALDRGLIDKPGNAPLRSMKGRLTSEANRGAASRLVKLDGDRWWLAGVAEGEAEPEPEAAAPEREVAEPERAPRAILARDDDEDDFDDEDDDEPPGEADSDDAGLGDLDEPEDDDDLDDDLDDELDDDEDDDLDDDLDVAAGAGAAPEDTKTTTMVLGDEDLQHVGEDDILEDEDDDRDDEDDDEGELDEGELAAEPLRPLTAEEVELSEIYGDEARATTPAAELAEYRDAQTADEDRPMRPEILPERIRDRERGRERFRRERGRRDRRPDEARAEARPEGPVEDRAAPDRGDEARIDDAGAPPLSIDDATPIALAERATQVLASMKGGQPVPVRQLAQMMRKRRLVDGDPERLWRPLKAALLHEQQRRQATGLSARVQYRGRDLFAYCGPGGAVEAAESRLEVAMADVAAATHGALLARLGDLQLGALEQLAHLYLTAVGYHGIEWIKRVDRSSYAVVSEAGASEPILVGVRAGRQPVDRRGVGELRAGVQAKNASRGLLFAARELGDEAEAELARPGKPLAVLCGAPFADALIRARIGVQVRSVPVGFLDGDLFDRLGDM